jgi:hypothetical protein
MNEESAGGISASSAGNIYVALSSSFTLDGQFNRGYSDVFVSALNSEGSRKWTRSIGSAGYDYPLSVTSSGNNFFISGSTSGSISGNPNPNPNNSNNFNKDLFVSKFDSTGKELWTKVLGLKFGWVVTSICAETSDGGILVALSSDGFQLDTVSGRRTFNGQEVYGNRDIVIVKLSAQGALQWTRILGSTESDYLYGLEVNADGNIFVGWSGYVGEKTLTEDSFITKLSPSGDIVWRSTLSGQFTHLPTIFHR